MMATEQTVKFRSEEWQAMFDRIAAVFGDDFLSLTLTEQNCLIRDCTEDGGVEDLGDYARNIGRGNLRSYARTQLVRFGASG